MRVSFLWCDLLLFIRDRAETMDSFFLGLRAGLQGVRALRGPSSFAHSATLLFGFFFFFNENFSCKIAEPGTPHRSEWIRACTDEARGSSRSSNNLQTFKNPCAGRPAESPVSRCNGWALRTLHKNKAKGRVSLWNLEFTLNCAWHLRKARRSTLMCHGSSLFGKHMGDS